jgi:hypothetical protein
MGSPFSHGYYNIMIFQSDYTTYGRHHCLLQLLLLLWRCVTDLSVDRTAEVIGLQKRLEHL